MSTNSLSLRPILAAALLVIACSEPTTSPGTLASPARVLAGDRRSAIDSSARTALLPPSADVFFSGIFTDETCANESGPDCLPTRPVCLEESSLTDFLGAEFTRTKDAGESERYLAMSGVSAQLIPKYEALYFQTTATPQYFGYAGEFTAAIAKTEREVKRFWDIASAQIQVLGAHGTMLLDQERVSRTYRLFSLPDFVALRYASIVFDALSASTTMNGGNFAIWTFQSASFRADGLPAKIVIGDGILEAYAATGYADVAPQAIFAHEYAHQIQFELGYLNDLGQVTKAESTRYSELMADAMAGYYLTHKRGGSLKKQRVAQFLAVFHLLGDCTSTSVRHGTPDQRLAAAELGFRVADEARKKGRILSSEAFRDLFLAYYPTLLADNSE